LHILYNNKNSLYLTKTWSAKLTIKIAQWMFIW